MTADLVWCLMSECWLKAASPAGLDHQTRTPGLLEPPVRPETTFRSFSGECPALEMRPRCLAQKRTASNKKGSLALIRLNKCTLALPNLCTYYIYSDWFLINNRCVDFFQCECELSELTNNNIIIIYFLWLFWHYPFDAYIVYSRFLNRGVL